MTIEQIKAECRKAIELSEKATAGPWGKEDEVNAHCLVTAGLDTEGAYIYPADCGMSDRAEEDSSHIAHARTFAPAAARALLLALEALEHIDYEGVTESAIDALDGICAQFEP